MNESNESFKVLNNEKKSKTKRGNASPVLLKL